MQMAWGVYSLRARGTGDPLRVTAGNFSRAVVFVAALGIVTLASLSLDGAGVGWAIVSGALASGFGCAIG